MNTPLTAGAAIESIISALDKPEYQLKDRTLSFRYKLSKLELCSIKGECKKSRTKKKMYFY